MYDVYNAIHLQWHWPIRSKTRLFIADPWQQPIKACSINMNSHDVQVSPPLRPTLMSLNIPTSYSWSILFATEYQVLQYLGSWFGSFASFLYNLYPLYIYNFLHTPIHTYKTNPLKSISKWLFHRQTPTIKKERSLFSLVCKTLAYTIGTVQTLQSYNPNHKALN